MIDLPNYLLDEKNLDFILLGFLQSDALEGRFGWYRQSSGANYHISVLQVVQSEKVIRTRSLIDQGFNMSEVKEIFSSTTTGETIKSEADFLTDNLNIQMENIQFHKEIQQEDQSIIYYVAGAIVRIVLKKTKCEKCREFLCAGNMPLNSEHIQDNEVRKEFTAQMSRGGLLKPSDIVYITCIHAYFYFRSIKNNSEVHDFLLNSSEPRSVFSKSFVDILNGSTVLESIIKAECSNGLSFSQYLPNLLNALFNVMAKNEVSEINDKIHVAKKRERNTDEKSCSKKRKIKKLKSN